MHEEKNIENLAMKIEEQQKSNLNFRNKRKEIRSIFWLEESIKEQFGAALQSLPAPDELAKMRSELRIQSLQARAVGKQLCRGDVGVCLPPLDDISDGCIEIEQAIVLETIEHTGRNHLGRGRHEIDPVFLEPAERAFVYDPVVAMHDDQARAFEGGAALTREEVLDRRIDGGKIIFRGGSGAATARGKEEKTREG